MENIIGGCIVILIALAVIGSRKRFVNAVVNTNNAGLGFYKYTTKDAKKGEYLVIVICSIAIILSILRMFGIFGQ